MRATTKGLLACTCAAGAIALICFAWEGRGRPEASQLRGTAEPAAESEPASYELSHPEGPVPARMEQLPEIETGSVPEIVDGGPVTIDSGWVRQYTGWSAADLRLQSEALMLKSVTLARDLGTTRLDVGEGTVIGQGNVDQIPKSENNPLYSVQVKQGEFRQLFLERERYPELYASYDEAVWLRSEAHRREHAHK